MKSTLQQEFAKMAEALYDETVQHRRHLHQYPELSFQENATADFVEKVLIEIGFTSIKRMAKTGVVALLHPQEHIGKVIGLRSDLDALPIHETNVISYKSKHEGVMHACGHDVHTSSLLGTAKILSQVTDQFEGTIKLIFQPGEEKFPGGASLMIDAGVLENPAPVNIMGQHVMNLIPAGKVGFREGMYMASADEIYITVKGKGGHAAMPDKNIDPILIASHIIIALQQVISRNCDPRIPAVLSFGKIIGMGATNVIPDEVHIEGTFRTLNEEWRAEAKQRIRKMAVGIAESMGATCDIDIKDGYPFLKNAPALAKRMRAAAVDFLGEDNVLDLDLWMAAEDFAYYSQKIDAGFYRLGIRNEAKGITAGVHTANFDIDETALQTGTGLMAWLALEELKAK